MKKNNLFLSLSMLVTLVIIMSSCRKAPEYTNVIPSDALLVASFNAGSLYQKCGLKADAKQKMIEAFKNGVDPNTFSQVEKILKDPDESGISVRDNFYLFCSTEKCLPSFVAKVKDETKLKNMFALLEKQQVTKPLEEKNACFIAEVPGKASFVFNKNVLLVSASSIPEEQLLAWMAQTADKSINTNKGFQKMEREKADIAAFLSMDLFENASSESSLASGMMEGLLPEGISLKDMKTIYTLNFEKGKIAIGGINYTENEQLKKFYEENKKTYGTMKGTFMDFFPASSLFYAGMNIKGEAVYDYLQKLPKVKEILAKAPIDWQKFIGSFDGDISVGLTGVSVGDTPALTAYAEVKDDYVLKTLLSYKDVFAGMGGRFKQNAENDYVVTLKDRSLYFGIVKKHLYMTTDDAAYKNINKSVSDPLAKAPWVAGAKNSASFAAINVNGIMQNPLVGMLLGISGKNGQSAKSVLSQISYIDISGQMDQTSKMNIVLNNKEINALQLICGEVEKLSGF